MFYYQSDPVTVATKCRSSPGHARFLDINKRPETLFSIGAYEDVVPLTDASVIQSELNTLQQDAALKGTSSNR